MAAGVAFCWLAALLGTCEVCGDAFHSCREHVTEHMASDLPGLGLRTALAELSGGGGCEGAAGELRCSTDLGECARLDEHDVGDDGARHDLRSEPPSPRALKHLKRWRQGVGNVGRALMWTAGLVGWGYVSVLLSY